jgi:hypothetical protein
VCKRWLKGWLQTKNLKVASKVGLSGAIQHIIDHRIGQLAERHSKATKMGNALNINII